VATKDIAARRTVGTLPNWLQGLLVLLAAGGALALLSLGLSQTRSLVVVEVDGLRQEVATHATTVGGVLRQVGLELYPEDTVSPALDVPLEPGLVIRVRRARQVALLVDGQIVELRTQATTIGQLLAEAGVRLGPADEIWLGEQRVGAETPLSGSAAAREVSSRGGARLVELPADQGSRPLISIRRAATIQLTDDGRTTVIHTTLPTVGRVLQARDVQLFVGDEVRPGLQELVVAGMRVQIERSVPVQIEVDGRLVRTRTRAERVAQVLGQEGIALVGRDRVEPPLDAEVRPNMTVRVTRVREEYVVEFDPIPFATEWVPDPAVEIDNIRLVQAGQVGLRKRRYRVVYEDGQEVERSLEAVWAAQPPITKTMAYGTKIVIRTLETPEGTIEYWRKIRAYTVSYKPSSCGKPRDHPRYGYTRLGWKLRKGIVAVDPTVIPLKTKMYIPGYGLARAGDTGGGVKGKLVDLGYGDDDYVSWHWWTDIYLLTPVPPPDKIRWILPDYPRFPDRKRH